MLFVLLLFKFCVCGICVFAHVCAGALLHGTHVETRIDIDDEFLP